jgi:hypothetical protein
MQDQQPAKPLGELPDADAEKEVLLVWWSIIVFFIFFVTISLVVRGMQLVVSGLPNGFFVQGRDRRGGTQSTYVANAKLKILKTGFGGAVEISEATALEKRAHPRREGMKEAASVIVIHIAYQIFLNCTNLIYNWFVSVRRLW